MTVEAARALGRFGKQALPAVPALIRLCLRYSPSFRANGEQWNPHEAAVEALKAIDPTGDTIVPNLPPDARTAVHVRRTVDLLEHFSGEAAKREVAELRKRWSL